MKKITLLLFCSFLINISIISAQEGPGSPPPPPAAPGEEEGPGSQPPPPAPGEEEDPELAAFRKEQEDYFNTGFELYFHYPLSIHFPGWSDPDVEYDLGILDITLPGPNISWGGLGAGFEIDFGSRKKVLRNMGFGSLTELSVLSSYNMIDGVDMSLLLNYPYLYYTSRRDKVLNFTVRAGMGFGIAINSEDLFEYPEEKDHPVGAVYALEGALVFSAGHHFRFQTGISYRYMAVNSKDMHIFAPLFRAGYHF